VELRCSFGFIWPVRNKFKVVALPLSLPLWISLRLAKLRVKRDRFLWDENLMKLLLRSRREQGAVSCESISVTRRRPWWYRSKWKRPSVRRDFDRDGVVEDLPLQDQLRYAMTDCQMGQPFLLTADRRTSDGRGNSHRGARSGDYQHTLRNISEERSPHLHRRGSLKSRGVYPVVSYSRKNSFITQNYCWEGFVFDCVNFRKECNWCQKWLCL
jgi:hypothetical protein